MRAPYAPEWFKSKRKDLRGISFQQHGSNSKSISQVVNSSVCGRAEQNAEVCIEVYLIAILLLIFQLPFLLLLRSAIYCGIRCSALLINSCRSPGMLALRGASSFSGFQGPCLHVEEHRRAGGGGYRKTDGPCVVTHRDWQGLLFPPDWVSNYRSVS